jgi:hypothetical protein
VGISCHSAVLGFPHNRSGSGHLINQPTRSRYSHRQPEMAAPLSQSVQRPGTSQLLLWVQCRSVRLAVGFWWDFGFDHQSFVGAAVRSWCWLTTYTINFTAGADRKTCNSRTQDHVLFVGVGWKGRCKMQEGLMRSRCAPLVRTLGQSEVPTLAIAGRRVPSTRTYIYVVKGVTCC